MDAKFASAVSAYNNTSSRGVQELIGSPGTNKASKTPGEDFSSLMKGVIQSAVDANKNAEQMSMKAIAGKADLNDVVLAVNAAEITLDTVVSVRDKVVTAYNEIIKMPI